MQNLFSITLRATNQETNTDREYYIGMGKDLFGQWCVSVIYGRYQCQGLTKMAFFETQAQTWSYVQGKLKRRASACQRIGCHYQVAHIQACPEMTCLFQEPVIQSLQPNILFKKDKQDSQVIVVSLS